MHYLRIWLNCLLQSTRSSTTSSTMMTVYYIVGKMRVWKILILYQMTPAEVRSYIAPTLSVLPSQLPIIVLLRFGSAGKSSFMWNNQSSVQEAFAQNKVTVMFSNSKSTSGDPVILGYIRSTLHNSSHPFPTKSKKPASRYYPFLWYLSPSMYPFWTRHKSYCGPMQKKSCPFLESDSALWIGWIWRGCLCSKISFAKMTSAEATALFKKHDSYIKSLWYVQLSPTTINNQ